MNRKKELMEKRGGKKKEKRMLNPFSRRCHANDWGRSKREKKRKA
jgi:hypothetical protein